jgi:uncharacterized membrane protein
MQNHIYLKTGKLFFAASILSIGIVHVLTGNFPTGLLPVALTLTCRTLLVYLTGAMLIIAGILIFIKRYTYYGALLTGLVFLIFILLLHLPKLIQHLHDPGEWTASFEAIALFSGALILGGSLLNGASAIKKDKGFKLLVTGRYIFALALFVFGVQHYLYAQFITGLIPAWIPGHLFWAYLVMVVFFATAVSIAIQKLMHLATSLLGLMFLLWVLILHLPRVIAHTHIEPEWTSLFIALAMSGIAFLIAGSSDMKGRKR